MSGPVSPTQRRRLPSADRRQQILDGSEDLFTHQGFEAISMGDIAAHLGISRPTVYAYFTSTADILAELLDQRLSEFEERLAPLLRDLHEQPRPFATILGQLIQERPLLTLLQSGSGPAFTERRLAVFRDLETRLHQHVSPPAGRARVPYLLTCLTLLLQATATHAITANLTAEQTGALAETLDRFVQAGIQGAAPRDT
ncbi:TetR/AcrR family transcriptional regulator [Deinococcus radiotolerans]|uniref:TetR family transcriptional regulator n=1 Tax=Deinococcus radiotolerans TaxID=1309407 RepID=A0ABQ2FE84_9DEIO|nr:TetR/AcrR family transcriptional regulator [Deinococcus radiotolerans]GGK89729.1 TetR family transcriptional regulator [Deinococcus radiotolerans]